MEDVVARVGDRIHAGQVPADVGYQAIGIDSERFGQFSFDRRRAPFRQIEIGSISAIGIGMPDDFHFHIRNFIQNGGNIFQCSVRFGFYHIFVYIEINSISNQFSFGQEFITGIG